MICKICGKEYSKLSRHLHNSHNIEAEDYYNQYFTRTNCIICGKPTKFINLTNGYSNTCSVRCSRIKGSHTTKEKYGYIPGSYGSKEYTQFMLNEYGVENPQQNQNIRRKTLKTTEERYNVSYSFLTEEAKQKTKINSHTEEVKSKIRQNNLEKYGVDNPAKLDAIKKKSRESVLTKHNIDFSIERIKLSNKELQNASNIENYFYSKLNSYTVLYNACSDKYPYLCDFYVKELDLYIELNFTWTHGWHYFDEQKDSTRLLEMQNKHNAYYDNAIYTWTFLDIQKRNCAIINKLNYVVVWNKEQLENLVKDISSISGFIDYNEVNL